MNPRKYDQRFLTAVQKQLNGERIFQQMKLEQTNTYAK